MKHLRSLIMILVFAAAIYYLAGMRNRSDFDPEVEAFIKKYFTVWSKHDLNAYASTFDPNARIYVVEPGSQKNELGLQSFLASQQAVFARFPNAYEEPDSINISKQGTTVECEVRWTLGGGPTPLTGTDVFKLKRVDDHWLIRELTVRNDQRVNP